MRLKCTIFVSAILTNVVAENRLVHLRRNGLLTAGTAESTCGCTTIYSTYTGEGTLYFPPAPSITSETIASSTDNFHFPVPTSTGNSCPNQALITVTETKYVYVTSEKTVPDCTRPNLVYPTPSTPLILPVPIESTPIEPTPVEPAPVKLAPVEQPANYPPAVPSLGLLRSSSGLWAITFSPYNDDKSCKSSAKIWADVSNIKLAGFKAIRIYSTDCSGLDNISSASSFYGMKLIIGIFIGESGCSGATQQVKDITEWGKWDLVELIVIGNEALFGGYTSAQELVNFIGTTKSTFRSAGYNGPCTTAEPLNIWEKNSVTLCDAVDVVGCNIHPFFNPEVDASHAGSFVKNQLEIVEGICPGKHGINLECGWPSAGECNGKACPGKSEQATAVASIKSYAGNSSVLFTYTDDYWKSPGAFHVEQNFGLIKLLINS